MKIFFVRFKCNWWSLIIVVYYHKTCASIHNLEESMSVLRFEKNNLLSLTSVSKTYIPDAKQIKVSCISGKVQDDWFWKVIINCRWNSNKRSIYDHNQLVENHYFRPIKMIHFDHFFVFVYSSMLVVISIFLTNFQLLIYLQWINEFSFHISLFGIKPVEKQTNQSLTSTWMDMGIFLRSHTCSNNILLKWPDRKSVV